MLRLRLVTRDAEDGDDQSEKKKAPSYSPSPARHMVHVEVDTDPMEPVPRQPVIKTRLTRAQLVDWATSPVTANRKQLKPIATARATWKALLIGGGLLALYTLYGYLVT